MVILICNIHFLRNGFKYQFKEYDLVYKYLLTTSYKVSLIKRHKVKEAILVLEEITVE